MNRGPRRPAWWWAMRAFWASIAVWMGTFILMIFTGFDANGFGSFSDIFDAFFGGATAGTRRGHPTAGSDLRYDLRITFEEAVRGTEKEIEFPVFGLCETCGGNGAKPGTEPVICDN